MSNTLTPSLTLEDIRTVSPALERYTQGALLGDVWKRPGLAPRDRSVITLAALIARNQIVEMGHHINLALDNGVKPGEISEIITHLAFYSGWSNALAAVAVAKDVFVKRGIGADQLPPASGELLPLDEAAESQRAATAEQLVGSWFGDRAIHNRGSVPRSVAASGSRATGSQPCHRQCPDRRGPGDADSVSPQQGDGQWPDASAGLGGHHASRLLRGLAQCLFGGSGRQRRFRETPKLRRL